MAEHGYIHRSEPGAGPGAPLLVLLHGTGGDEHQLIGLGRQLLPQARLVAPRGDVSEHGAARFFRRTGEGVYDMDDFERATDKLARFVAGQAALDTPAQTVALGYSNGANVLASLLFSQPQLLDRAVLMHPLIPFMPEPQPGLAGKPILITAGRRDPIGPAALTQALADYLKGQGAQVTLFWHDGGHEVAQAELAAVQEFLNGLGT